MVARRVKHNNKSNRINKCSQNKQKIKLLLLSKMLMTIKTVSSRKKIQNKLVNSKIRVVSIRIHKNSNKMKKKIY